MRTNPFYDTWLFLIGQQPDEVAQGGWRWLLVGLFLALLVGSVVLAVVNWRDDPGQRSVRALAIWLARLGVGGMWFQGSLWKLPLFTTENGLFYWTQQMVEHSAFDWHREFVSQVVIPNFVVVGALVYLAELAFAVSLMLGLCVRLIGWLGFLFVANLWIGLYRQPAEWPWNYVFLSFLMAAFALCAAGRALGLDAVIRRRLEPVMIAPAPLTRLVAALT